jgi:phosphoribosylformylglycinamidine synthase
MLVELDKVPLREPSMSPLEVLTSESQERMLAIVEPRHVDAVLARCTKWGVVATVIGEVTDSGRLVVTWRGETVVDVPPGSLADDGPVYHRPLARPVEAQDALAADSSARLPRPKASDELRETMLRLVSSPELCSRRWVTEQYDRYVLGGTVLAMPHDSGVVRLGDDTTRGIALSLDGNGRFARLDPHAGAQLALSEAYRNVSTVGAKPLAVTNCLNFGSPEDPAVMWQFAEAVRGLADACLELGVPVTGGNVSFYNSTGDTAILPTPVVGVLGVIDDVARRVPMALTAEQTGNVLYLLGETRDELGGSEWAYSLHGHLGGMPPRVDLAAERKLSEVLVNASRDGLLDAAHDLADGGLAVALVEMVLRRGMGARVWLPEGLEPVVALFSESVARAVVSVPRSEEVRFQDMCIARRQPHQRIGVVDGEALDVQDLFRVPVAELREAHTRTLPAIFESHYVGAVDA